MRRGDLVTIAVSGDYGKPRPALIVQADAYDLLPSVTVLPLTSEIHDAPLLRVTVPSGGHSGLNRASQVMIDKAITVPRARIGRRIGEVDVTILSAVNHALAAFLGLE